MSPSLRTGTFVVVLSLVVLLAPGSAAIPGVPPHPEVVLLGFGPFEGYPVNPTERLVREVAAAHPSWVSDTLPVDPRGALERLYAHLDSRPRLVVGVGVRADVHGVQINPTALNWISMRDGIDWLHYGPIDPGLPVEISLDAARRGSLVRVSRERGLGAEISDDAGVHVCNLVLFHGITHAPVGVGFIFVHVPSRILEDPSLRRTFEQALDAVVTVFSDPLTP